MRRPGEDSGGGGFDFGGHSSSRDSGGHRVGSDRPGMGSDFERNYERRYNYRRYSGYYGGSNTGDLFFLMWIIERLINFFSNRSSKKREGAKSSGSGTNSPDSSNSKGYKKPIKVWTILFIIMLICSIISVAAFFISSNRNTREKLDVLSSYNTNCVIDNEGWFDSVSSVEKNLKSFYDKTGVQPYIVINSYDSDITSDEEKIDYSNEWYSENIDNEASFVYMYFAESDPDTVGYMTYVTGKQASSVMDSEVIDKFWSTLDKEWYSDKSSDDLFISTFNKTASYAMKGYSPIPMVVCLVLTGICLAMVIKNTSNQRELEKAQETKDILDADLDDLADKYK